MVRRFLRHSRQLSTFTLPVLHNRPQSPRHVLFNNKRIKELNDQGLVDDARHLFDTMSQRDEFSWNTMITGYTHHGRLSDAQSLFEKFDGRNVRTWTILLSGYVNQGLIDEAKKHFESMPERNVVSWNTMVSAYLRNGNLDTARKVFDEMPERDLTSWNSILRGYCCCGDMNGAQMLFNCMSERDVESYLALTSGYLEICDYRRAWKVFSLMQRSKVRPDNLFFVHGFLAVMGMDDLRLMETLRTLVIKFGFEADVYVGTTILKGYTKYSSLDLAIKFFQTMPLRNDYSWNTMISALSQSKRLDEAIALYGENPQPNTATKTALITAYSQNGKIQEAKLIFDEIPDPTEVTWNAMLSGYSQNGMLKEAMDIFLRMPAKKPSSFAAMISSLVHGGQNKEALYFLAKIHQSGVLPTQSGFTSALSACTNIKFAKFGKQIHALTIKSKCQHNPCVGNGLISMYSKNHMLDEARQTFKKMPVKNVISWTSIISGYEQQGHGPMALEMFVDMLAQGFRPSKITATSLVSACSQLGATKLSQLTHCLVLKLGFESSVFVSNALITMYFKSGSLDGLSVLEQMHNPDIISWNATLSGCAINGQPEKAIAMFKQMEERSIHPDQITFVAILTACSHGGMVDKGWDYFNSMKNKYRIAPSLQHYTCMVDLLGRAGKLSEAETLIEKMPKKADPVIWGALLAACKMHCNIKLGERVAERIFSFGTPKPGTFALISNMYSNQNMREKVQEIRRTMRNSGVAKERGVSWIQIKNRMHYFVVGDTRHEQIQEIHSALNEFYGIFRASGYVPDTRFAFHGGDDEEKESEILFHSEKLAVIYGLLNTPSGATVQIMKNLRTCGDCHTFFKFMSVVSERKIIIRDGHRFHHFKNGVCSCKDYW